MIHCSTIYTPTNCKVLKKVIKKYPWLKKTNFVLIILHTTKKPHSDWNFYVQLINEIRFWNATQTKFQNEDIEK
jgi:hypothetical protein